MPTITDIPFGLSVEEITGAWGAERARLLAPSLGNNLQQLLRQITANHWLEARISYRVREVTGYGPGWLTVDGARLESSLVARYLRHATHLVFGICTLGEKVQEQMRVKFKEKKHLQAVLLDEIGTLLLYKLCDHFEELMCQQAKTMQLQASGAYNPGDEGFDISQQGRVLELAGGRDIGVTLQGGGILVPHKSLTAVVGLGRRMPVNTRAERCARCHSRERCPHRQDIAAGAVA